MQVCSAQRKSAMFPVGLNDLASPVLITRGSRCVPQFVIPGEFFMKLSLVCLSLAATLILVGSLAVGQSSTVDARLEQLKTWD